jgi:hypothetical protein
LTLKNGGEQRLILAKERRMAPLIKDGGPLTKGTGICQASPTRQIVERDAIKAPIDSTLGACGAERGNG